MEKQFSQLNVGDKFFVSDTEYVKTTEVDINCCTKANAYATIAPNNITFFQPNQVVTVNG